MIDPDANAILCDLFLGEVCRVPALEGRYRPNETPHVTKPIPDVTQDHDAAIVILLALCEHRKLTYVLSMNTGGLHRCQLIPFDGVQINHAAKTEACGMTPGAAIAMATLKFLKEQEDKS